MSHHVLVLGGHGKIAQILTRSLLRRAWTVTSLIRTAEQVPSIKALQDDKNKGTLHVLVRSLEAVKSEADAKAIVDEVGPDYVVWSAGAGGKGGPDRTLAIDRDAAIHFIRAAAATPSVTRFLLISYPGSRRRRPSWWTPEAWAFVQKANKDLGTYAEAKIPPDEELYRVSKKRGPGFAGIDLRPGLLTDEEDDGTGGVELGRTRDMAGSVRRGTVARVAEALLAQKEARSAWIDLLGGDEPVDEAVARVVREGVDAVEGEPVTEE